MNLFKGWLRRRAAKRMAARLPTILATSYVGSEFYTVPQIKVAFAGLRLHPDYIDIAYAAYLDFAAYSAPTSLDRAAYDAARSLYRNYLPDGYSSSVEPAPVNEYIGQMSGLE